MGRHRRTVNNSGILFSSVFLCLSLEWQLSSALMRDPLTWCCVPVCALPLFLWPPCVCCSSWLGYVQLRRCQHLLHLAWVGGKTGKGGKEDEEKGSGRSISRSRCQGTRLQGKAMVKRMRAVLCLRSQASKRRRSCRNFNSCQRHN